MEQEHVVLLDAEGHAIGTTPKASVHHDATPLHLAFSCYAFDEQGRLLVSQRALHKATFPGLWTNSLCGHPAAGESLESAVTRRAESELGMRVQELRVVLPQFAYRATMDGIVEWEMCPVLVARVADGGVHPNPDEVEATEWVPWQQFAREVLSGTRHVSPWCVEQVQQLAALGEDPLAWPTGDRALLPPALQGPELC